MKIKFRDIGNILLDRISILALRGRKFLQVNFGLTHNYHPDPFKKRLKHDPRASYQRFDAMFSALSDIDKPSVIDIGCHQGFFTFKFAEKGGICMGFDNDRAELLVARARSSINKVNNVAFLEMYINPKNITSFPNADIVVFMSVFHHWVRYFGKDDAIEMFRILSEKAIEGIVFDSGQFEENTSWSPLLDFMSPSSTNWIEKQLKKFGFKKITKVGEFETSLSNIPRTLFVARR